MHSNHTGFTLVELVVVTAIIAILSGIAAFSMTSYIASSRDMKRMVDVQSIAVNLDIYYKKNGSLYPDNIYSKEVLYTSGGLTQTGGKIGEIHEDQLPDLNQMPVDPKKKSYYIFWSTLNRKKYEIASRLEKTDNWQIIASNIHDPDIFGDNIYIVGNYRQDTISNYPLRGLIVLSGSTDSGFTLPDQAISIGTWSGTTASIDYDGSWVVLQKSQKVY